MKIYTKAGDQGMTSLYGGKKISKSDLRIESYGTIDELNSFIGLLMVSIKDHPEYNFLVTVQNELFAIGSHLAAGGNHDFKLPEIKEEMVEAFENHMDNLEQDLPPLKHFVLPGGSLAISHAHVCRTISRRAERRVVQLALSDQVEPIVIKYLNRLSDYFFMLGRHIAFVDGVEEHKWIP